MSFLFDIFQFTRFYLWTVRDAIPTDCFLLSEIELYMQGMFTTNSILYEFTLDNLMRYEIICERLGGETVDSDGIGPVGHTVWD